MGKDMDGIPLGSSQLVTKTKVGLDRGSLIVRLMAATLFQAYRVWKSQVFVLDRLLATTALWSPIVLAYVRTYETMKTARSCKERTAAKQSG